MKTLVITHVVTLAAFAAIDFVWLSRMGDALYRPVMGDMLLTDFRLAPALIFYLVYTIGLVFFAVRPSLAAGDWVVALSHGALFGFVAYATYDLTNQATLKNWSTVLTIADLAWGSFVSAAAATIGHVATTMAAKVG